MEFTRRRLAQGIESRRARQDEPVRIKETNNPETT